MLNELKTRKFSKSNTAKNHQNRFFFKKGVNTTYGSGFHFRFVIYALDFVENDNNVEGVPPTLFEIFGVKGQNFKK